MPVQVYPAHSSQKPNQMEIGFLFTTAMLISLSLRHNFVLFLFVSFHFSLIQGVNIRTSHLVSQDEDLADVAAKQYYVEYGKEMLPDRLLNLLPSYLPESQLQGGRAGLEKWAHLVMNCHKKVCHTNKHVC